MKNNIKRLLYFVSIFLFLQMELFSQDYDTYDFDDGTSIDVKVISLDPDEGLKGNAYIGGFIPAGHLNFVGYNHYIPTKMYLNGSFGLKGGLLDASFFFFNKTKDKRLKQSIKSTNAGNTTTKYMVKIPSFKRRSIGVHTGLEILNYKSNEDFQKQAIGIVGGLTILGATHANLKIKSHYKERRGSMVNRLNIDFILYPIRKVGRELLPDETIDDLLWPMGLRIYYDGKASVWSRTGQLTLNYMFGVGIPTDPDATPLIIGLGLGYGFH